MTDCGNGIYCIDAHYRGDEIAAVFLLVSQGRAALIETANNASVRCTLAAMERLGVDREDADFVCVTHVHLDHAGGAGLYMQEFPNAKLVLHPRGARHMADPSRLMESVRAVYGRTETERLYGELVPVPQERMITPGDGERLTFGNMTLRCINAPGHAEHQMVFFEESTRSLFAGDAFGISYPWMKDESGRRWAFPSSSPVQFSPEAMASTIDRIMSLSPARIFLTHFGEINDTDSNAALLKNMIKEYAGITAAADGDEEQIRRGLSRLYENIAVQHGSALTPDAAEAALSSDAAVNAQGLAFRYKKTHEQGKV
ncbi:MAG: MBL fold metallo-hydrolase [Synergistes sp.]|nr:MBL fold metallo-hydrolase [Synergistes sp.]